MGHESFGTAKATQPREDEFGETLYADDFHGNDESHESSQEVASPEREPWNPEEDMARYQERLSSLLAKQQEVEDALAMIHDDEAIASRFDEDQMNELFNNRENLQQEVLAASANYPGDWTLLLRDRMLDPTTKERFIAQRREAMFIMKQGPTPEELIGTKHEHKYESHYEDQVENYDRNVGRIFGHTEVRKPADYGLFPHHLGRGGIGTVGTVFTDAIHKGVPLTSRQMNIVEAHEKGHGLRDYTSPLDKQEIQSIIDDEALATLTTEYKELERLGHKEGRFRSSYVERPDEIIERMAQFKNYFGMGAQDTFEKKHLDHIRAHYVADTGLDNNITDLLQCVTPETEAAFLKVINKYPI
jgi:hypothetical protein